MKKTAFFFLFLCISVALSHAQNRHPYANITGTVIDAQNREALPGVTIRLLQKSDSTLITGTLSQENGSFSMYAPKGAYFTRISYIGYADVIQQVNISSESPFAELDTIALHEQDILLNEMVFTAVAPEIILKGDTLEYDAGRHKLSESAMVEDLLKKLSGVEVGADGKIKVNGKEIKEILLEGKEFFSSDPKVASKNLPAKMIDKVQVVDKKSESEKTTGFDDGEEQMVINLTVKPSMKRGAFGNLNAGYGSKNRYETSAMVNSMIGEDQMTFIGGLNNTNNGGLMGGYGNTMSMGFIGGGGGMYSGASGGVGRSGNAGSNFNKTFSDKFDLGGSVNYDASNSEELSKTHTQNLLSSGNTNEDKNDRSFEQSHHINFDLQLEWRPDTLTSINFRPNLSLSQNRGTRSGTFVTASAERNDTINQGNSDYSSEGNNNNFGANLNISRRFRKPGRNIHFSVNISENETRNKAENRSDTHYNGTKPSDRIDQRITNNNNSSSFGTFLSYMEPLGKAYFLQLTYQYRQNGSESDRDTRTADSLGQYTVFDKQYSKRYVNNNNNQDLSLTFRARKEKYTYSAGLSLYPSTSKRKTFIGDSLANDIEQPATNFSPNAQFFYNWSRQKSIRFNYRGNTQQPSVDQLSSVVDISDPLNITYGNPHLRPSFRHRMDVQYQHAEHEKNRFYMLYGNFNLTQNAIVSSRYTDPATGRNENTYKNVNGNWNVDLSFITNQPFINKKFSFNSSTYGGYNETAGFSNNEQNISRQINLSENLSFNYRSEKVSVTLNGNISYNDVKNSIGGQNDRQYVNYGGSTNALLELPYDIKLQTDIRYSSNSGYSDGFKQNELWWDAAIEKQILRKKNGTIRFKIYDILQQRSNIQRMVSSNYITDTTTNTLTGYFMFHFIYRFNFFKGGGDGEVPAG
ncbi:MAG TPA: TonB-dependent receptor [Porphyromonadaceae bacterium]|jgi:hypothetical protein|uniref:TonB-dependent receptor n=1 Tax=Limibacterium fermenti TaxID=3229863 RepID=UPI000E94F462|nr:TonB-dependent receptor [Porphyromonadaceae bacterium]HBL32710.1 TonB-dependent receptor [Porphyromonadaceae bacterium]HBX19645.1 TonB-dependent receptor [Porphyromonadaceae bacterium]HBX45415.1 TonB-dependent receptor [Porphyromonadaceae bacterium]